MNHITKAWYTPAEVAVHNTATDCWVSLNGKVLNLTSWLQDQFRICKCRKNCSCPVKNWCCGDDCVEYCPCFKRGFFYCDGKRLAMTILAYAGKDITPWFKDEDWKRYTHPVTGQTTTFHQHGHDHLRPVVPSTKWRPYETAWWKDEKFVIGNLTKKTRPIRITNTLIGSTVTLEVCSEETIAQIMLRYLPHNSHMMSYAWRYMGNGLCLNKTLAQNGIPDEREAFSKELLPENHYIPSILLYFNDDLTEDPSKDSCVCTAKECLTVQGKKCDGS